MGLPLFSSIRSRRDIFGAGLDFRGDETEVFVGSVHHVPYVCSSFKCFVVSRIHYFGSSITIRLKATSISSCLARPAFPNHDSPKNITGVRTFKVVLPPRSERDRRLLIDDKNAWAGVPVGVATRRPPPERLGAPPRPGTITATRAPQASIGGAAEVESGQIVTKYNWLPAPLVGKAALLQTRLQDR